MALLHTPRSYECPRPMGRLRARPMRLQPRLDFTRAEPNCPPELESRKPARLPPVQNCRRAQPEVVGQLASREQPIAHATPFRTQPAFFGFGAISPRPVFWETHRGNGSTRPFVDGVLRCWAVFSGSRCFLRGSFLRGSLRGVKRLGMSKERGVTGSSRSGCAFAFEDVGCEIVKVGVVWVVRCGSSGVRP